MNVLFCSRQKAQWFKVRNLTLKMAEHLCLNILGSIQAELPDILFIVND